MIIPIINPTVAAKMIESDVACEGQVMEVLDARKYIVLERLGLESRSAE